MPSVIDPGNDDSTGWKPVKRTPHPYNEVLLCKWLGYCVSEFNIDAERHVVVYFPERWKDYAWKGAGKVPAEYITENTIEITVWFDKNKTFTFIMEAGI